MCREVIAPAATCLEAVLQATPLLAEQQEDTQDIQISHKVRLWQKEMARLRQQQQEKGGQIDVNALDDVIDETWVSRCYVLAVCRLHGVPPAGETNSVVIKSR